MTVDRGSGDEVVRFSNRPVAGSPEVSPRLAGDPQWAVEVGLWIWNSRTRSGFADAEIINADGGIDWLADAEVRDKPAWLLLGRASEGLGQFEVRAALTVDFVGSTAGRRFRVAFAAPDIQLDSTLQTAIYLPGAPNPRLEGLPVPISLGRVFQVPAVLYDEAPDIDYDCHVVMPARMDEVASAGNPALQSQWVLRERGFRLLVSPSGRVTADLSGPQKDAGHTSDDLPPGYPDDGHLNASANSDFDSWNGKSPVGYSLANANVASPEKKLERYQLTNTLQAINRSSSLMDLLEGAPRMSIDLGLVQGRWYGARLDFVHTTGWTNQIGMLTLATGQAGSEADSSGESHFFQTAVTADQLVFFRASGPVLKVFFGGAAFSQVETEMRLDTLRVWDVEAAEVTLAGLVIWVLDQAGWTGGVDLGELDALDVAIGAHELGLWLSRPARTNDVLDRLLAPFLAWRYVDEQGTMRFGRLMAPEDIPGEPELEIGPERLRAGESVQPEDDLMPGLTDVFGAMRNQQPLAEAETAPVLDSLQERADRAAEFRFIARGDPSDLAPFYAWAHDRCVFDSGLQDETSAQQQRDRTAGLAATRRRFWRVPALMNTKTDLRPGQKILVRWPGFGLQAGREVALLGWSRSYLSQSIDLICWS